MDLLAGWWYPPPQGECEGEERVCEGEERVCEGEERVCEGEERVCEGGERVCEGEERVCEGGERVWEGEGEWNTAADWLERMCWRRARRARAGLPHMTFEGKEGKGG